MQRKRQSSTYGGPDAQHGVIPETTFKALFGRDHLNVLVIRVKQPEEMDDALVRLNQVLGPRLGYDPEDTRVFGVWNTVEGQKMSAKILLGLELFFGIIGALTLIIGGVGVANIMYAVVKERTREIGVKMALGARRRWITGPFILEGLVYTLVGGLFGAFIAIVIVTLLGLIPIGRQRRARVPRQADAVVADRRRDRRDPRHGRTARRVLPRAPRRVDRPCGDPAL